MERNFDLLWILLWMQIIQLPNILECWSYPLLPRPFCLETTSIPQFLLSPFIPKMPVRFLSRAYKSCINTRILYMKKPKLYFFRLYIFRRKSLNSGHWLITGIPASHFKNNTKASKQKFTEEESLPETTLGVKLTYLCFVLLKGQVFYKQIFQ